jgi:hypothetical protein
MRRHIRSWAALLSSLAAFAAFPAAGSSSTTPAFRSAMNGICKVEAAKTHAAGAKITSVGAIATYGPALVTATTAALAQLKKLGTPPAAIARHASHYVATQAAIVKVLGQAVAAAERNDLTTAKNLFTGSYKTLGQSQHVDAEAIGATACIAAAEPK